MGLFRNYLKKDTKTPNQSPVQSIQQSGNASEYTFDVVGESFQRDHLVQLIKNNNSAENGELFTTATLELESDNLFDSTAVVVVIQNLKVGYIPKSQSAIVTDYIKSSGHATLDVPARLGWDTNSPQPLIGVRLKMEGF